MKKVLYIGGFELPDKNAAAQRVMSNAILLRDIGFEVSFIYTSKEQFQNVRYINGFKCSSIPYPKDLKQWLYRIFSYLNLKQIEDEKPAFVILYNFPSVASLKILYYCHKNGIKVIEDITEWESAKGYSVRSIIKKLDIFIRMRFCVKKMDGVIAISKYLYNYYKDLTKTIFVPPTVDLMNEKWQRKRDLIASSAIRIVYAGNAGYGNKDRLDYIVNVVIKYPKISLDIVGMTLEQYEQCYERIPSDALNIHFRGWVSHKEAVNTVCKSDFQILIREDNLKTRAGFPTKFVESMSCCTPVIANLTSDLGDYLTDGKNGFVVSEQQKLDDVFKKISNLSPQDIINMKHECKKLNVFDYRHYKNEISKLFQS